MFKVKKLYFIILKNVNANNEKRKKRKKEYSLNLKLIPP